MCANAIKTARVAKGEMKSRRNDELAEGYMRDLALRGLVPDRRDGVFNGEGSV